MSPHEETTEPPKLSQPNLTQEQQAQLQELLGKFQDVVCTDMGKVDGTERSIDTD